MSERPLWAGWLPDEVQQIANTAVRAGIVPLVDDDYCDSAWLLRGERRLGLLCQFGTVPVLILDVVDDNGDCVEIRGAEKITAWLAGAVDSMATPR
jgi:hypothetical protein